MDVCGLAVHQVTYRDIWVRRVIIIYIPVMPVKIPVIDLVMTLVLIPVIRVMIPVMDSRYDSCYGFLL